MAAKKTPNPIDKHVGSRVRMRRMMLNMSQEKLGDALHLTFQQVQKYEKGTNRIGASRLQQISEILRVPVAFFFDGQAEADATPEQAQVADYTTAFLADKLALAFARAWSKIESEQVRRALVAMAEASTKSES